MLSPALVCGTETAVSLGDNTHARQLERILTERSQRIPSMLAGAGNYLITNSAEDIEEVLDEGYFKTGDQVSITIQRKSTDIYNNKMEQIEVNLSL